ncbi:MAG: CoA-binding protein, partial [Dehalococcoidia bacterium]
MTLEAEILTNYRTIAVVGLSSEPLRPAHSVSTYMKMNGCRIIPVKPGETEVLGEMAYPDLSSVPEPIEIVNIFRRPEFVPDVVEEAIAVGAKAVWMQEGIVNGKAAKAAEDAGLLVVMDR